MFAKYSQLFGFLSVSSMTTLLVTLRTGATITTYKEAPHTTDNHNRYNYSDYSDYCLLPITYHSNNVIW